jgi:hypothetical protein
MIVLTMIKKTLGLLNGAVFQVPSMCGPKAISDDI